MNNDIEDVVQNEDGVYVTESEFKREEERKQISIGYNLRRSWNDLKENHKIEVYGLYFIGIAILLSWAHDAAKGDTIEQKLYEPNTHQVYTQ